MGLYNDGCNEGCGWHYASYYLPTISYTMFQWHPSQRLISNCNSAFSTRLAGPNCGTGTGPDRTDFSAVQSQSKRPDRETVSIFGPDRTETFIAQAFMNKHG